MIIICTGRTMTGGGSVISILVFALLLSLAQGQCDNSCVHSQCNDKKDAYDYPNPPDSDSTYLMLYELLEQSLLNDRVNLYLMRHTFFPNGRPKPIVVTVTYSVSFHNITNEPCAGAFNGSKLVEGNSYSTANYSTTVIWTSSITLSLLHPEVIDWLTPTLLYVLGPIRASYFDHSSILVNLYLPLNVPFLPCTPSHPRVMFALDDITTMLKAFAEAKGPVSCSNPKYKGFTIQDQFIAKCWAYGGFSILTIVLTTTTFLVYREFIIIKWVNNLLMSTYKALWVNVATLLFIIVYVSLEILGIGLWLSNENRAVATVFLKFVVFLFTCCILPLVLYCRTGKGLYKSWCFLILLTIVVWGLAPTVILTFVNPVQTLGIMLSVISLIVLYISSVSTYTLVHLGRKRHIIVFGFSSCGLTLILFVEYLLHSGVDTDGIHGLVLSFAPGFVIAIANWTFRKYFVQYKKDSGKEVGNGDHSNNPGTDIKNEEHSIPNDSGTAVANEEHSNDSGTDVENEEHSNDCGTDV